MTDFAIRPEGDTDWSNAVFVSGTLPVTGLDAASLGLTLGQNYEIVRFGTSTVFAVTDQPAQSAPPSLSATETSITVTLAADPSDGGSLVTARDIRYSTDQNTWTEQTGITSPVTLNALTSNTLYFVQARVRNTNGAGAWSASASVSTNTGASAGSIEITEASFSPSTETVLPAVFVTASEVDTTPNYTLYGATHAAGTTLSVANVLNGTGAAIDTFATTPAAALTGLSGMVATAFTTGLADGHLSVVIADGAGTPAQSDPFQIDNVTVDVTPPVLTGATAQAAGTDTLDGSVTSDEPHGTLFWVVTQSATAPSPAQVLAGQDHTGASADANGSQAVSGTGTQTLAPAPIGLAADTSYRLHFAHRDGRGNISAVVTSAAVTTDASSARFYDNFSGFASGANLSTGPYAMEGAIGVSGTGSAEVNGSSYAVIADAPGASERIMARYTGQSYTGAHLACITVENYGGAAASAMETAAIISWSDPDNYASLQVRNDGRVRMRAYVGGVRVTEITEFENAEAGDRFEIEVTATGTLNARHNGIPVPNMSAITPGAPLNTTNVFCGMYWQTQSSWSTSSAISEFICEAI